MMSENQDPALALPAELQYVEFGGLIWPADQPGVMVADTQSSEGPRVRGWGYLIGTLHLSEQEAMAYQDAVGRRLVACWNLLSRAGFTEEDLKALTDVPPEVLRVMLHGTWQVKAEDAEG